MGQDTRQQTDTFTAQGNSFFLGYRWWHHHERSEQGQAWGHPELPGEDVEGTPPWLSPSLFPVTCLNSPEQSPFSLILFHFFSLFHCSNCACRQPDWRTCSDPTDGVCEPSAQSCAGERQRRIPGAALNSSSQSMCGAVLETGLSELWVTPA